MDISGIDEMKLTEEEIELSRCPVCREPVVPDKKAVTFGTKKWDGHTFKAGCECADSKWRLLIG